VGSSRV